MNYEEKIIKDYYNSIKVDIPVFKNIHAESEKISLKDFFSDSFALVFIVIIFINSFSFEKNSLYSQKVSQDIYKQRYIITEVVKTVKNIFYKTVRR